MFQNVGYGYLCGQTLQKRRRKSFKRFTQQSCDLFESKKMLDREAQNGGISVYVNGDTKSSWGVGGT
jgi:hypothetical protein